jgi:hypothetical protein
MKHAAWFASLLASTVACGNSSNGVGTPSGGGQSTTQAGGAPAAGANGGTGGAAASAQGGAGGSSAVAGNGTSGGNRSTGGATLGGAGGGDATGGTSGIAGGTSLGGAGPHGGASNAAAGSGGHAAGAGGGSGGVGAGGQTHAAGQAGQVSDGGSPTGGAAGSGGALPNNCVGKAWPTADPTVKGPFAITTDKNVGPLAGYTPDPIYGDTQQRFNVYRPKDLATSGYCHPILVWANGHGDNPEQNPPLCVVDSGANKWCGTYPVLIEQLASHGFVVVASLSSTTSKGDPLPTIVGLNWLLDQVEDSTSPYYHHLDTAHIGALGHSEGGLSTCKAAADPRISAIGTVSGTSTLTALHGPALFICGGQDTVVSCDSVAATYNTVKDQPAMMMDNLSADHGGWEYQNGAKGPDIFALTAWFRVQLMGDTANRKYFYGTNCTLCTDNRVTVMQNSLMTQ